MSTYRHKAVSCANVIGVNKENKISALMEFPFGDRLSGRRVTIGEVVRGYQVPMPLTPFISKALVLLLWEVNSGT